MITTNLKIENQRKVKNLSKTNPKPAANNATQETLDTNSINNTPTNETTKFNKNLPLQRNAKLSSIESQEKTIKNKNESKKEIPNIKKEVNITQIINENTIANQTTENKQNNNEVKLTDKTAQLFEKLNKIKVDDSNHSTDYQNKLHYRLTQAKKKTTNLTLSEKPRKSKKIIQMVQKLEKHFKAMDNDNTTFYQEEFDLNEIIMNKPYLKSKQIKKPKFKEFNI